MGALSDVAAQHVSNNNLGEIDISNAWKASIIEMLGKARVSATWYEKLRSGSIREVGEMGEEGVTELRPVGVPLEGVIAASYGEELVPVLFAREVS